MPTQHYSLLERGESSRHDRRNPDRHGADPENPLQQRLGYGLRRRVKFIAGEGYRMMLSLYPRKRSQLVVLSSFYTYWARRVLRQVSLCLGVTGGACYVVCVHRQGFSRLRAPLGPNKILRRYGNY